MNCLKAWKTINTFIEVSEDGDVKSHGRIIKGEICRNGYRRIHVQHDGNDMKFLVHRLVAEAFIPNPEQLPVVNHIDGNKLNNAVDNLEWCDYSDNLKHAYRTKLRSANGESNNMHKLTAAEVQEIRRIYVKRSHGMNSYDLAKKFGVAPKTIQNIVNGKAWKTI